MNDSNISLANVSNISSVNTYCKYLGPESDVRKIATRTTFVVLIVVGISLNIFVIILAANKFTVRKNLHHLIINMAVSDTIFLVMTLLFYVPWLSDFKWKIYPSGILGVIFCKTVAFLYMLSCRVSLITLLIISIQRFKATTLHRTRPNTLKQRIAIIAVCWLIPIGNCIIHTYMARLGNYGRMCAAWTDDYKKINRVIFFVQLFHEIIVVILCCVTFFLGILTTRRLAKPKPITNHLSEQRRSLRTYRTQAAVKMILASVSIYTCCHFPFLVFQFAHLANLIIPSADIIDWSACIDWKSLYFIVRRFLPALNSCFSPCIYVIFLSDFREATKKVLCRKETLNQAPNRGNPIELQPVASPACNRRARRRYELNKR